MSETDDLRPPEDWVQRHMHLIPNSGPVLDLAAGRGRHSRLLADAGYKVTAADRDVSAFDGLADIRAARVDLEAGAWPFADAEFAGIVVTNYLYRPLFGHLIDALQGGGALIYQTFAVGNEAYGRPKNPGFFLRPGELLEAFAPALTVIAYQHGIIRRPEPAVIQSIAAVKSDAPQSLYI